MAMTIQGFFPLVLLCISFGCGDRWFTGDLNFIEHCRAVLAGLAFMFSMGILMQILGCALYNNWWPMLSALMYVMVPMPCLFFGGGSSTDFIVMSGGDGDWMDAAKFLTGFSAVGSVAIPAILHHAKLIEMGAMLLELLSFAILLCTVILFQKVNQEDDYGWS